jgi:hypothetical protein
MKSIQIDFRGRQALEKLDPEELRAVKLCQKKSVWS